MPRADQNLEPPNIRAAKPGIPSWDPANVADSLNAILIYVEGEAQKAIDWYWKNKRQKAALSQFIRFSAVTLTAMGGLFPIAIFMLNPLLKSLEATYQVPESGLVSSLLVGLAAALYGLDKAFGYSSGWTRYVLTATILQKTLEEFRLQWISLSAKCSTQPTPDQIQELLICARDFRVAVATAVLQETKDWVTEFQNSLVELERDTRTQLESLRVKVDRAAQARLDRSQNGAVELLVTDADRTDGFNFEVAIDGETATLSKEVVLNSKQWTMIAVTPGQYRLQIAAKVGGHDSTVNKVLIIKPGEVTRIEATLLP